MAQIQLTSIPIVMIIVCVILGLNVLSGALRGFVRKISGIAAFFLAGIVLLIPQVFETLKYNRKHPIVVILLLVLFWVSVYSLVGSAGNPFMYFQF